MNAIDPTAIQALHRLLTQGEAPKEPLAALPSGTRYGLWTLVQERAVATAALVRLWSSLPDIEETVAAVVTCEPTYRGAWLPIVAARLQEMGQRQALAELCRMIDALQDASGAVRDRLPQARLHPTSHGDLERALFGATAEQAQAVPRLLRAIGATASLVEKENGRPATPLPRIDSLNPPQSWCQGRMIQLPATDKKPAEAHNVLSGSLAELAPHERGTEDTVAVSAVRWALHRPWAMLLAQVVFSQEAWDAERITGGLFLELPEGHLSQFHHPLRVDVVVVSADGREILCGSLGQLVLRVLATLGIGLLAPQRQARELDERLGYAIERLLENKVWHFDDRAGSIEKPGYRIHEQFSSSAYRIFGSKYFYRQGALLAHAVRRTCQTWAEERMTAASRSPVFAAPV